MKENDRSLILVGGGGHCKSVIEAAESVSYKIAGILDVAENVGKSVLGYNIIGTDDQISEYIDNADFLVTVGQIKNVDIRIKLHEKIKRAGGRLATLIASTAYVSKHATVEEGTVILHQAMVNAGAKIGKGCIINTFVNIEHDAFVGDYCHISTGTMVNGDCTVSDTVFIGSQSVLANGITVCDGCIIAAGSVVCKNISLRGIYSGNPSIIKKRL